MTKLSPDGGSLLYSTYLDGIGSDAGQDVAVNAAGHAYVFGQTEGGAGFPIVDAFDPTHGGNTCDEGGIYHVCADVFITVMNPTGSGVMYSTFFGGNSGEGYFFDEGGEIALDSAGYIYVTGYTDSLNFPVKNAIQPAKSNSLCAWAAKFVPDGSELVFSTYLGGSPGGSMGRGIGADSAGHAYVTGRTCADNFPTTPSALKPTKPGGSNNCDAFVLKFAPEGGSLLYGTFLGGNMNTTQESGRSIKVDAQMNAYVAGYTISSDFPTANAFQAFWAGGGNDAFITKLNRDGDALVFSSYLGGTENDAGQSVLVDKLGNVYVGGLTESTDFPTVDPYQAQSAGQTDGFVTKVGHRAVSTGPTANPTPPPSVVP